MASNPGISSGGFTFRHITPIFAGNPEWIVEHKPLSDAPEAKPTLVCWCPTEFSARLIANALNGE